MWGDLQGAIAVGGFWMFGRVGQISCQIRKAGESSVNNDSTMLRASTREHHVGEWVWRKVGWLVWTQGAHSILWMNELHVVTQSFLFS